MENQKQRLTLDEDTLKRLWGNKYVRGTVYVAGGLVALYALGHVFRIFAGTVKGYRELKNSFSNNNPLNNGNQ